MISDSGFLKNLPDYKRWDLENIQRVGVEMGIQMTLQECHSIWEEFSDSRDAQWLGTQSDEPEDIHEAIRTYIEKRTTKDEQ